MNTIEVPRDQEPQICKTLFRFEEEEVRVPNVANTLNNLYLFRIKKITFVCLCVCEIGEDSKEKLNFQTILPTVLIADYFPFVAFCSILLSV